MKLRFTKTDIIFFELIGVLLLHVGELAIRFPCNHTNSLMFSYRDCVFSLAIFEFVYSFFKREICVSFWLLFVILLFFPMFEDFFNIMISYETWISRGMPSFGTVGTL